MRWSIYLVAHNRGAECYHLLSCDVNSPTALQQDAKITVNTRAVLILHILVWRRVQSGTVGLR
jgi:hypothetical protein